MSSHPFDHARRHLTPPPLPGATPERDEAPSGHRLAPGAGARAAGVPWLRSDVDAADTADEPPADAPAPSTGAFDRPSAARPRGRSARSQVNTLPFDAPRPTGDEPYWEDLDSYLAHDDL